MSRQAKLNGKSSKWFKKACTDTKIVSFCGKCKLSEDILEQNNIEVLEIAKETTIEESIKNGSYYLKKASDKYFEHLSLAEKIL